MDCSTIGRGELMAKKSEMESEAQAFAYICEIDGVITIGHPELKGEGCVHAIE